MFRHIKYFFVNQFNFKQMKIKFEGRVLDDQTREFQKEGKAVKKRVLYVYQEGEKELIPVNVPVDAVFQKESVYEFDAILTKWEMRGKSGISIKSE